MDVLSDVIATVRTGEPRSALVQWRAPWGQRFAAGPGAGFQVVLQGSCWLIRPDEEPVALGVGDVVFLPHGRGHALADHPDTPLAEPSCDPPGHDPGQRYEQRYAAPAGGQRTPEAPTTVTLCGAYQLDPERAHPLLGDLPDLVHLPARLGRHPEIRAAVDLLAAELERPRLGADAVVPALLDMLLLYVLRAWFEERPGDEGAEGAGCQGWTAALRDPVVSAALHAIHRDPGLPWTVAKLGAEAGSSRAAFARRFTALVGRPPLAYLTWWRMTSAARLLSTSETRIALVAERVGYTSEFAFANAFKREYGTSPGRYRRDSAA
ncbi:AraC family transcriptional regulator [Streptomyces sp. NBC_01304]|uniref:AraC family transcriptional regulator n=1 Tax=Streptomyces sp. NBC_01304 TaxID=2903818 RepID=UPI002E148BEB|nr:AraC family transcriptional regulator [Streptomyces sp. NBC_01304]